MRSPTDAKLVPLLCLALGFVAGALLSLGLGTSADEGSVARAETAARISWDAPLATPPPPVAPVAPVAPEKTRHLATDARRSLGAPDDRLASDSPVARWSHQIQEWAEDGGLLELLAHDPVATGAFLFEVALARGDGELALLLLDEGVDMGREEHARTAALLYRQGDLERATELYLEAFAMELDDDELLAAVAELAPERALALYAERPLSEDPDDWCPTEIENRAVLLDRVGRGAEATSMLLAMLEVRSLYAGGLEVLARWAPAQAQALLRENLNPGGFCGNPALAARNQLLDFYELQGRTEDVVRQLTPCGESAAPKLMF